MSILSSLFGSDSDSSKTSERKLVYSNCTGGCKLTDAQCEICKPYKKDLLKAIYNVEHKDEILAKYEVTGEDGDVSGTEGTITCPFCGAPTANFSICEYCGSKIGETTGKIKVKSAADIPNPVMEAQTIIFNRYAALKKTNSSNDDNDNGILETIKNFITGDSDSDSDVLGAQMSETEIESMASVYGVSVASYLTGLDNGTYLTKSAYEKRSTQSGSTGQTATGSVLAGAAAAMLGSAVLGGGRGGHYGSRPPMEPPRGGQSMGRMQGGPGMSGRNGMGSMGRPGGSMGRSGGSMGHPGGSTRRPGGAGGPRK